MAFINKNWFWWDFEANPNEQSSKYKSKIKKKIISSMQKLLLKSVNHLVKCHAILAI